MCTDGIQTLCNLRLCERRREKPREERRGRRKEEWGERGEGGGRGKITINTLSRWYCNTHCAVVMTTATHLFVHLHVQPIGHLIVLCVCCVCVHVCACACVRACVCVCVCVRVHVCVCTHVRSIIQTHLAVPDLASECHYSTTHASLAFHGNSENVFHLV